jgi:hypothetical protein
MSFESPYSLEFPSYVNGKVTTSEVKVMGKDVKVESDFTPDWNQYMSQLTYQLQINLSPEGITLPSQNTANIAALVASAVENGKVNNKILINSDTGDVQAIIGGVLKTFVLV